MSQPNLEAVTKSVQDAIYVTVGAGVLAYEQAEKRWQELTERVSGQFGVGKDRVDQLVKAFEAQTQAFDSRIKTLEDRIDEALAEFEERLPERAGEVVAKARTAAAEARRQMRDRVAPKAA